MGEKTPTALVAVAESRWRLLAPFRIRVGVRPEELAACFESQPDVTVASRWPRSDAPRRWFVARRVSDREVRLRIAPKQTSRKALGNVRASIDVELRLTASGTGEDAAVEVRLVPVVTAGFYANLLYPGAGIFFGAWALFGAFVALPVTAAVVLAITWPRRLFEDVKELRNKVSGALGPVLLEEESGGGYRSDGRPI